MRVEILGCSGGIGSGGGTTCLRIDDSILIDCGTGIGTLATDALSRIEHLFLTHVHMDHVACLPMLADALLSSGRGTPLNVHAPEACLEALRTDLFNGRIWPNFLSLPTPRNPAVRLHPLEAGASHRVGAVRVEALPAVHLVPAVGYRVQGGAGVFAFGGDCTTNDAQWEAINGGERPDLLIVECSFPDANRALAERSGHYAPELLANDLEKLAHDAPIGIFHMKPGGEVQIMSELQARVRNRTLRQLHAGDVFEF